jgi:serine/threonine protein kinase/tetratricopeptide (TPR) repeat protein
MSDPETRWSEVAAQFDEIVELAPAERAVRLADLERSDPALAGEVRGLLDADDRANALLDADAAAALPGLLDRAPEPGDAIAGPYRLLRPVGEGGMGVVWLAERVDGTFEQQVAVKVLKQGMDTQAILRRFLLERRILARLRHRHIVRLIDGGSNADGRPFYVMDYVEGQPITDYAAARGLDVRNRVTLLATVADAVAYAHAQLVVHRDLKPSNVLVDAAGEPRVLDFGIAKLIEESGEHTMTGTGLRVLSPAYAAPEQILGEPISTATDVYALGLMLTELLVGELPQRRRTAKGAQLAQEVAGETSERASTLAAHLTRARIAQLYGNDTEPRRLAQALAGDLDLIIGTALQRDPARRYATATAFADDLRRWLDARPIAARADSAAYRFVRFVRRHRVGVAATVLVALSLLGGLGAALWQAHIARAAAAAALIAEEKAQQQAAIATAVSDFLTRDVIQAVNPYRNKIDIRLTDALIKAGSRIDERFKDEPRLAGVIRRELADALYLAGEVGPAEAQARKALATLEAAFGAPDADALESRVILGTILHRQDNYVEARSVYQAGIAALGDGGPKRLRLEFEVGMAGLDLEDRKEPEALAALAKLIPEVEATVGAYEPLHIKALDHAMRAHMGVEHYAEALALARQLRSATEKKFGVGDVQTLEWIKREGIVLNWMERFDEALAITRQACDATRASLGDAHFGTADCNLRLGIIYFNTERYPEALALFEPVAALRERGMGPDAEGTWLSWVWLARGYQKNGQLARARALFERIHATADRVYGEGDAKALPFAQTLGMFLQQTGALADAGKLRLKLLDQTRKAMPEGHIMIAKMAWDVGETLAAQKRDADLVAFYAEWLPQWDAKFAEGDSRRTDAHKWLAEAQQRIALGSNSRR